MQTIKGRTWKLSKCIGCGAERYFKYSVKLDKYYNHKIKCKKCTLTERNRKQNFSPRKHPINDYFEIIDTSDKAYIFGFLWADGCLMNQKRKNKTAVKSIKSCIQGRDEEVVNFIITKVGGSKIKKLTRDNRNSKDYEQIIWSLNSKAVYENFVKLAFRKNLDNVPIKFHSHFMCGLIDGDGSFRVRDGYLTGIKISSNYNQDWTFLSVISKIKKYSITYDIGKRGRGSNFNINGTRTEKIEFLRWLYNDRNFYLKRKFNKIKHELLHSDC